MSNDDRPGNLRWLPSAVEPIRVEPDVVKWIKPFRGFSLAPCAYMTKCNAHVLDISGENQILKENCIASSAFRQIHKTDRKPVQPITKVFDPTGPDVERCSVDIEDCYR